MAQVEIVIQDVLDRLDSKIAVLAPQDQKPKPRPLPPPPPPTKVPNTHFTYLANLIRSTIGYQTLDPGVGLSLDDLQDDIAYGIFFIGGDVYNLAQSAANAIDAAKAYTDAEVKYVAAVTSGQGAASAAAVLNQARAWFNQAEANITTVWTNAYQTALNAQHSAEVYAQVQVNNEAAVRSAQVTGLSNSLNQKFGQAESDISAVLAAAVSSAVNAQHSAETFAQNRFDTAEADISTVWQDAYSTALAVKNDAEVYTDDAVSRASTSILAQAATQLETKLAPIATEIETCLDPMCDTVAPNAQQLGRLGSLLKGLEDFGLTAALLAFITEAVVDPVAAASQAEDVLGWTSSVAVDLVDAVF